MKPASVAPSWRATGRPWRSTGRSAAPPASAWAPMSPPGAPAMFAPVMRVVRPGGDRRQRRGGVRARDLGHRLGGEAAGERAAQHRIVGVEVGEDRGQARVAAGARPRRPGGRLDRPAQDQGRGGADRDRLHLARPHGLQRAVQPAASRSRRAWSGRSPARPAPRSGCARGPAWRPPARCAPRPSAPAGVSATSDGCRPKVSSSFSAPPGASKPGMAIGPRRAA